MARRGVAVVVVEIFHSNRCRQCGPGSKTRRRRRVPLFVWTGLEGARPHGARHGPLSHATKNKIRFCCSRRKSQRRRKSNQSPHN